LQQPTFTNTVEGDYTLAAGSNGKGAAHDGTDPGIAWNAFLKKGHMKRIAALETQTDTPAGTSSAFTVDPTAFYQVRFKVGQPSTGCTGTSTAFVVEGTTLTRDMSTTYIRSSTWMQGDRAWVALGRHRATDGTLNVSWPHANCVDGIHIRKLPSADEAWIWVVQPDPGSGSSTPLPEGAVAVSSDAEENLVTGNVTLSGQELEFAAQRNATPNAVAVRLTNLPVVQGDTCTASYLAVTAGNVADHSSGTPALEIEVETSVTAATFAATVNNLTGRTVSGSPVTWNPATWTQNTLNAASTTPDLCSLLQPLFDDGAWDPQNNAVVLLIRPASGSAGHRIAQSLEAGGTLYLVVETEATTPETPIWTVTGSPNDAEENLLTGNVTLAGQSLELGQQVVGTPNAVFLRFQDLAIPQGSVCQSAPLTLTATNSPDHSSGSPTFLIRAVDDVHVPELVDVDSGISALITGAESVTWSPPPWTQNTANPASTTVSLCPILQPLFSDAAWSATDNAIGLIITHQSGSSGYRIAKSVDAGGLTSLIVEHTPAETGAPVLAIGSWQVARADSLQTGRHFLEGLNTPIGMPSPSCMDVRMQVTVSGGDIGPVVLSPVYRAGGAGAWAPVLPDALQPLFLGRNRQVPNGTATVNLLNTSSFVAGRYLTTTPNAPFSPITLQEGETTELVATICLKSGQAAPTFYEMCLAQGATAISCPNPPRIDIGPGMAQFKG
jgi:hypothetical protein